MGCKVYLTGLNVLPSNIALLLDQIKCDHCKVKALTR